MPRKGLNTSKMGFNRPKMGSQHFFGVSTLLNTSKNWVSTCVKMGSQHLFCLVSICVKWVSTCIKWVSSQHAQNGSQHSSQQMEVLRPTLEVLRPKTKCSDPFWGSQHLHKQVFETQTKSSQHLELKENHSTLLFFIDKISKNKKHDLRVQNRSINKMLLRFTGPSTGACVMWRCPQHDNTMTMLTLNTRTR